MTPDDGSDDCFVHVKDNPELKGMDSGGAAVTFDKELNPERKGKYKGTNCTVTGGGEGGGGYGGDKGKGKDEDNPWEGLLGSQEELDAELEDVKKKAAEVQADKIARFLQRTVGMSDESAYDCA